MRKNRNFGDRLQFALHGIRSAIRSEASFRFQLVCAAAVLIVLTAIRPPPVWWALLLGASSAVLSAELLNTALEKALDRFCPEEDPAVRIAKDTAAGAVLVLSLTSLMIFAAFLVEVFGQRLKIF